ncbi:MAG: hypothetical protein GAK34_01023 [Delftia tsuruhatensis]|nr:MAG: hypothetical protein GAK34_01023 [Delftia tsuruhatensis]
MGLDLLGGGVQLVGAHQLGHHQAQAHAALGLGQEHVFRDLGLVGVLDAALLQLGAGAFQQTCDFSLHRSLRQFQLGLGHQGVHHGLLVAALDAELDFTLQVLLDVGAQAFDRAFSHAQGLGKGLVHFGQVGGLDLLDRHEEVGLLAGHVLAVVVGGESQGEGLGLAGLHAAHGVFEFLEHLAFADQELEVFGLAAGEGLAVDLAFEVHGHAVAVHGHIGLGALREGAALLAQDVHGLVDGSVVHFGRQLLDFGRGQVTDLDFRHHFEDGFELGLALGSAFLFGDAGLAGHAQLGFVDSLCESLADLVVEHFVLHRIAITLGHHAHRHLAGTEAVHLHGARHLLEAVLDFALDGVQGQAQRDLALELFKGFNSNGHVCSYEGLDRAGCCTARTVLRKSHGATRAKPVGRAAPQISRAYITCTWPLGTAHGSLNP